MHCLLLGLRQKTPTKEPQMYIEKDLDILLVTLLIYLGLGYFGVFRVFPLLCMGLRLASTSKMFKYRYKIEGLPLSSFCF